MTDAAPIPGTDTAVEATPEDVTPTEEGYKLLDSGLILVWIDGKRYVLRRPKAGEYRYLRELLQEQQDEIATEGDRVQLLATAAAEAKGDAAVQKRTEFRTANRGLQRLLEAKRREWLSTAFARLADGELPAADELPVWFESDEPINAFLTHWKRVPSLRGAR